MYGDISDDSSLHINQFSTKDGATWKKIGNLGYRWLGNPSGLLQGTVSEISIIIMRIHDYKRYLVPIYFPLIYIPPSYANLT